MCVCVCVVYAEGYHHYSRELVGLSRDPHEVTLVEHPVFLPNWARCLTFPVFPLYHSIGIETTVCGVVKFVVLNPKNLNFNFSWQAEGKYKDDPVDLRLDIERRKKHKERDLKRGKSRESVDSRDSSHSRERSAEKTEKTHKGSKKQKYVNPCLLPHSVS